MKLTRRRFLAISAASLAAAPARAHVWRGQALGAEVEITIRAPRAVADSALVKAIEVIRAVEARFSLFDPSSRLSALNAAGRLDRPDAMVLSLFAEADRAFRLTGGLFDPTVQPLWRALAEGQETETARALIGWERVRFDLEAVELGAGQALTFNGIAQGFATDRVAEILSGAGLREVLVNIGEFRANGGPWRLGLSDPGFGYLGTRTLNSGAIATSSPMAVPLAGQGHILHRFARPLWSTVSVEAEDATTADAFSTALTLARLDLIASLPGRHGIRRITLVNAEGEVTTVHSAAQDLPTGRPFPDYPLPNHP